ASPNFPTPTPLNGELGYLRIHARELSAEQVRSLTAPAAPDSGGNPADASVLFHAAAAEGKLSGKVLTVSETAAPATGSIVAAAMGVPEAHWTLTQRGDLLLHIPAGETPIRASLRIASSAQLELDALAKPLHAPREPLDLAPLTQGGPANWGSVVETLPQPGDDDGPYAVDVLTRPAANPWMARVRLTGFDFFADGDEAAVCTWDGDVWRVTGIDRLEQGLQWRRIASGLFQPLGLKIVNGDIYVGCRDQIAILRDLNDDGETDFYETFNSDHQVTEHFHEFAMGLQRDVEGNFYYAKSARHALPALVPHHGTLLRVTPDGARTDILATGFRAANGVCLNPDGTFIVTDQEGHWNPKNRINWVRQGGFYGNMYGYHDVTNESDDAMEQPLCWITNAFDRSPAELLWVDSKQWGPLSGSLLNLSYGYGRIFVVPHETINGQTQGGMCQLPIPDAPTGLIRGRFHPGNGQLYACGMFAWAGSQQQPGGFYRVRYTGQAVHLPVGLEATARGMRMTFSGPVNPAVAQDVARYQVSTWSLKRTKNYGSQHYDTKSLAVKSARVSGNGRIIDLELEGMQPTWCMEIKYQLEGAEGEPVEGVIHNTVHQLKQ
ncbi:MAG: hypothetical protein KDB14_09420, partial [Planctomycetales bacterium]|nr:hypothetical protein [Planctomycetales bacterium]